jgi:hypothetical protein
MIYAHIAPLFQDAAESDDHCITERYEKKIKEPFTHCKMRFSSVRPSKATYSFRKNSKR